MGALAETAIASYRYHLLTKDTSVFRFHLQQKTEVCQFRFPFTANNGSCRLPFH
jgi:hypothetical protein